VGSWKQALEHTAEFSPGPYAVGGIDQETRVLRLIGAPPGTGKPPVLAIVFDSPAGRVVEVAGEQLWDDPEQHATGLVMADAPAMLKLLCLWADMADWIKADAQFGAIVRSPTYAETCQLIRRHVRLFVGPVDDENHAPKTEAVQPNPLGIQLHIPGTK
jgi:hypothetical protein